MSGFKLKLPPAPPPVIAPEGAPQCGDKLRTRQGGVKCERPEGHDGGHRSATADEYWRDEP